MWRTGVSFSAFKDLFQRGPESSRIWALKGMILYAPEFAELYSKLIDRLIAKKEFGRAEVIQRYTNILCLNLDFFSNTKVHELLNNKDFIRFNDFKNTLDPKMRFPNEDFMIFEFLLGKTSRVLNIGAHNGATAFFMSRLGAEEILSVEPNPSFYETLDNLKIKNHRILQLGLSDEVGTGFLYCPNEYPGRANILESQENGFDEIPIQLDTIDNLLLNNFNYWKIDVEGSELKVLEGAVQTLEKNPPDHIQIEVWENNVDKIVNFLCKFQYYAYKCQIDGNFIMRFSEFQKSRKKWKTINTPIMIFSKNQLSTKY